MGAFPNFRRARVVWLAVEASPRLELLQHDIETACAALGYEPEGRPFRPHLTLGRVRNPLPEPRLRELAQAARAVRWREETVVESVDLMRSELGPGGSRYSMVERLSLRS